MSADIEVVFLPDGARQRVAIGRRVLAVVREADRPIGFSCRGLGVCRACAIWVAGPQSPIAPDEQRLLDGIAGPHERDGAQLRIACLARLEGDVTLRADYW